MTGEVETESPIERNCNEGHYNYSKDRVGRQYGEVKRTRQSRALKPRRAMVVMIREVRSQKERGYDQRGNLTSSMSGNFPPPNKRISGEEEYGASSIQTRV